MSANPAAAAGAAAATAEGRSPLIAFYWIVGIVILVALLLVPALGNNYLTHVVIHMLFFAYLGTAWNIMGGYTGQLSFGHAAFFGIGAYTSTLLFVDLGITPWIGMFVGGALACLVGLAIGYVGFSHGLRGVFFAFLTLATAEIFRLLSLLAVPLTRGAEGILLPWRGHDPANFAFGADRKEWPYYVMLVMAVAAVIFAQWLKCTRFGYRLVAIRENEEAAEMLGINGPRSKIFAIGISGFMTALAGTFYAQYFQHFEPFEVFGPVRSFEIIFPVIIGGGGYVVGPPIGAFVLQFFEETSRAIVPPLLHGVHRILYGLIMMLMIIYLPQGIAGLLETWRHRYLAKQQRGG